MADTKITDLAADTAPATNDYTVTVDVSDTSMAATGTDKKVLLADLLAADGGWWSAGETWTYASGATTNVGTFTIAGVDKTGKYQAGDKVKFTQTTVKYAIITKVAFSTDTTITIYMGTDYTIANAAISANYYSKLKSPQGFPLDPVKWTETTTSTSDVSGTTTAGVYINPGSLSLAIPIGAWDIQVNMAFYQSNSSSGIYAPYAGLSTANNSASDNEMICDAISRSSGTAASIWPGKISKRITLAAATTYYLVATCQVGGGTLTVGFNGVRENTVIRAICAYL